MTNNNLVRVAEFYSSMDANMVKGIFESNNIFSSLDGEMTSDLSITISGIGDHIYLTVLKNDLPKAIELLKGISIKYKLLIDNV